jgi:hypothetical protein
MISQTVYSVPKNLIQEAIKSYHQFKNNKIALNKPTGNFFYDPWVIKEEFKNTIWEELLDTLPIEYGEARVIILKNGTCYQSHADIDDRYHLNLLGNYSYLIDLDKIEMFKTTCDYKWYTMDTGKLHTAVNFGEIDRVQLVVRHLLKKNILNNPISVELVCIDDHLARYYFDETVSKWLNKHNKDKKITNFSYNNTIVKFDIENDLIYELKYILPKQFVLITN